MLKPWIEAQARLVEVAAGRAPADLVIRGGVWVNVHTGELLPGHDVAIADGRVACVLPDAAANIGPETQVIEAAGRYMVPGLIDAHMHVESGLVTVTEFARAVIPHGTTSMFIDPHEIANVLGLPGVRLMHDEARGLPVNVYVQVPSCVPSAPGLEHAGAELTPQDIAEAFVAFLGAAGIEVVAMGSHGIVTAADLARMYTRYAERQGWAVEVLDYTDSELGGYKDVRLAIKAKGSVEPQDGVWAHLKYEGGVHRVQRVPVTESGGRIHTSAATVAVLPEAEDVDITVNDAGSDDFSAYKGEVRVRANKTITVYRWGGSACPGKDLSAANVALLFEAAEESAKITPKYKPGAGSNKCLTGFKTQFKKDKGPS